MDCKRRRKNLNNMAVERESFGYQERRLLPKNKSDLSCIFCNLSWYELLFVTPLKHCMLVRSQLLVFLKKMKGMSKHSLEDWGKRLGSGRRLNLAAPFTIVPRVPTLHVLHPTPPSTRVRPSPLK